MDATATRAVYTLLLLRVLLLLLLLCSDGDS
jgi:hypothetical protein